MRKAGDKTLAQRLREEGRLSLDLLRRFGEELLEVLHFMEDAGVTHRDIKPDNIGIAPVGEKGMLHAVLFDFSLARTPAENILAGTPGYLDPFLSLRKPARWDLYAERYAAAVTLYEMATGTLPVWGDGQTAPDMLECEATLNTEAFDPNVREGLSAFFEKALRRDFRQRFDNAEEMLRAWRRLFDEARQPTTTPDMLDADRTPRDRGRRRSASSATASKLRTCSSAWASTICASCWPSIGSSFAISPTSATRFAKRSGSPRNGWRSCVPISSPAAPRSRGTKRRISGRPASTSSPDSSCRSAPPVMTERTSAPSRLPRPRTA